MKIVYVAMSSIPSRMANSIHVMKMCQAFVQNGHEVLLIIPEQPPEPDLINRGQDLYDFYGVDKCFEIKRLRWLQLKGRALFFGVQAALIAKKVKADLLYGRDINGCYFATLFRIPVIFESHQPIISSGALYNKLFKKMVANQSFRRLVVISEKLKTYYQKTYTLKKDKLLVAHDAACLPSKDHTMLPAAERSLDVCYTGHLYPGKGMEIITLLAEKCPWAKFHVIGGSEKDIFYWKEKIGRSENIVFHGFKNHSLIAGLISSYDILLAPYQEKVMAGGYDIALWMSPLKIFEYMAAAKPIICSDLPVLREVLEDGVDALLCPPADIDCWVEALQRLRDDQSLRRKLGQAAYTKFINHYTWEKRAGKVLSGLK